MYLFFVWESGVLSAVTWGGASPASGGGALDGAKEELKQKKAVQMQARLDAGVGAPCPVWCV